MWSNNHVAGKNLSKFTILFDIALLKSFDVLTEKIQYFILERVGGVSTFEIQDGGGGSLKVY